MYSRSYKQDSDGISIPDSYSGVAFREPEVPEIPDDAPRSVAKSLDVRFTAPEPPDPNLTASTEAAPEQSEETVATGGFLSSLMDKLPMKSIFAGMDFGKLSFPKIGTEEILIIGLAIFLFLSRDGDKECAVLLLLLLFIR